MDRDPYRVLVSELMLQQTTVVAVVPLYERWMERFPTLESLADATSEQVMEAWSGLGYYSRATRLHQTAQRLREHAGYPTTLEGWLALPGLGPYTAAAVISIAQGRPHLALDTNALRVLFRYFGWRVRADNARAQAAVRQELEQNLIRFDFGEVNQAMMELGASLCRVRSPLCAQCPLEADCQAGKEGSAEEIPVPKPKNPIRRTSGRVYLIGESPESLTLVQGTSLGLLGQLYQPLIDLGEENRTDWPFTPLLKSLEEDKDGIAPLGRLSYGISGRKLELELFRVRRGEWDARLRARAARYSHPIATVRKDALEGSAPPLSSLTRKILKVWAETP